MTSRRELDLTAVELATAHRTQVECAGDTALAERCLGFLNEGLNLMPDEWKVPDIRSGVILQLTVLGYDSLRWAFEMSIKGYYAQSHAMVRTAWESWLHAAYLHVYPEKAVDEWRDFRTRPKPVEMRRAVAARSDRTGATNDALRAAMNDLADTFAGLSHPSNESVRLTLGTKEGALWLLRGGEFDRTRFLQTANVFSLTACLLSTMLLILLPENEEYRVRSESLHNDLASWRSDLSTNPR